MKCQTILLKKFFGLKGAVYYKAIAMVIFSHVKFTCEDIKTVFARKLTWYFLGVYIINIYIFYLKVISDYKTSLNVYIPPGR